MLMLSGALATVAVASVMTGGAPPNGGVPPKIAFARLAGGVGFCVDNIDECGFDGKTIADLVQRARKSNCAALMLEIESPGGHVREGEKIVDQIIDAQGKGLTVIAWYGQAFSAASWIPFAAKAAIAKPTGTCGGSVIWKPGADGKPTPVDAKMASATIGKVKNAAHSGSKDPVLVDAIFRQDAEVWQAADGSLHAADPGAGSKCIDDGKTVLNFDAKTATAIGFAKGTAVDRDGAVRLAGFGAVSWIEITSAVDERAKRIKELERKWITSSKKWFGLVGELFRKIDKAIEDSRATAMAYDLGLQGTNPDIKNLGQRARKALKEFHSDKFGNAVSPSNFDEALWMNGEEEVREKIVEIQRETSDKVGRIVKLLESRKVDKIDEAAAVRDELLLYLKSATQ